MIQKIINIFKVPELRKKLGFTALMLLIFRLGGIVLLPGLDRTLVQSFVDQSEGNLFGLYNLFAGGFFTQFSIFALGIMPYISASIIIQLLSAAVPYFQRLQKEGEEGRKKIIQLTRYGTVLLAFLQSIGVSVFLTSYPGTAQGPIVPNPGIPFILTTIIILVTGVIFVMWMGEQISDYGIGNGISLIIMVGILSRAPHIFVQQSRLFQDGLLSSTLIKSNPIKL